MTNLLPREGGKGYSICHLVQKTDPKMEYCFILSCAAQSSQIGSNRLDLRTRYMPNDAAEDLDPDQMSKNSGESVEKMRCLMNEMKIVQEYENAIRNGED